MGIVSGVLAALATGCSGGSAGVTQHSEFPLGLHRVVDRPPADPSPCPTPQDGTGGGPVAIIDYVDFVQFDGRQYLSTFGPGDVPRNTSLGRVVGHVRCMLPSKGDPTYRAQDGDAAFLRPGTPLHLVPGWPARCRIAARTSRAVRIYVATRTDTRRARPVTCAGSAG